jgi:predicted GIY-YIG superfamily endonuclease
LFIPISVRTSGYEKGMPKHTHTPVVYCIATPDASVSYVGWTNNFPNRLRKHRGEIKGGAGYTSRRHAGEKWALRFMVHGFPSPSEALSLEKQLHLKRSPVPAAHRRARNVFGTDPVARRAWKLYWILQRPSFSSKTKTATANMRIVVYWRDEELYRVATRTADRLAWPANVSHVREKPAFLQ